MLMHRGEDYHSNLIRLPLQSINLPQPVSKQLNHGRKSQEKGYANFQFEKNRQAKLYDEKERQKIIEARNEQLFEELSNNHSILKQLVDLIDHRPSGCKPPVLSFNNHQKRSSRFSSKAAHKKNQSCQAKMELRAVRQQLSRVIDLIDSRIEYHDQSEHSSFSKIDQLNEVKQLLSQQNRGSEDLLKKEEMINHLKFMDRERIMAPRSGFFSPQAVSSSSHMLNDSSQDQSVHGQYYLNLKNSFDRMNERELKNVELVQSVKLTAAHQRNKSNKSLESLNFIHQTPPFNLSLQITENAENQYAQMNKIKEPSNAVPLSSTRLVAVRPTSLDQRRMPSYIVQRFQLSPRPQFINQGGPYQQNITGQSNPVYRLVSPRTSQHLMMPPMRKVTKIPINFNISQPFTENLMKSNINATNMQTGLPIIESNNTTNYLYNTRSTEPNILTSQSTSRQLNKRKKFSFNDFFKRNPTLAPHKNENIPAETAFGPILEQKTQPVNLTYLPRPFITNTINSNLETTSLSMPSTTSMFPTATQLQLKKIVEVSEENNSYSHVREVNDLRSSSIRAHSSIFYQTKASQYSNNSHFLQKQQGLHNSNPGFLSNYYRLA